MPDGCLWFNVAFFLISLNLQGDPEDFFAPAGVNRINEGQLTYRCRVPE